jgi:hypothetical protein
MPEHPRGSAMFSATFHGDITYESSFRPLHTRVPFVRCAAARLLLRYRGPKTAECVEL